MQLLQLCECTQIRYRLRQSIILQPQNRQLRQILYPRVRYWSSQVISRKLQLCDSRSAVHRTRRPVVWDTQTRIPSPRTQVLVRLDSLNGKSISRISSRQHRIRHSVNLQSIYQGPEHRLIGGTKTNGGSIGQIYAWVTPLVRLIQEPIRCSFNIDRCLLVSVNPHLKLPGRDERLAVDFGKPENDHVVPAAGNTQGKCHRSVLLERHR